MSTNELEIAKAVRVGTFGAVVSRASDILPDGENYPLFNVIGGRVAITQIIGEVTTVIQTQANNTKLTATPTDGTAVDLCAALNIAGDEVGTLYGITGTPANAMTGTGLIVKQAAQVIVNTGTIDLDCAANSTGEIKWSIYYIPMDEGAYVEAATAYVTTEGA
jgi:hypothetical protein